MNTSNKKRQQINDLCEYIEVLISELIEKFNNDRITGHLEIKDFSLFSTTWERLLRIQRYVSPVEDANDKGNQNSY